MYTSALDTNDGLRRRIKPSDTIVGVSEMSEHSVREQDDGVGKSRSYPAKVSDWVKSSGPSAQIQDDGVADRRSYATKLYNWVQSFLELQELVRNQLVLTLTLMLGSGYPPIV